MTFRNAVDAAKAVKEYNGRSFDNRPMKIELLVSATAIPPPAPATSRLGAPLHKQG